MSTLESGNNGNDCLRFTQKMGNHPNEGQASDYHTHKQIKSRQKTILLSISATLL